MRETEGLSTLGSKSEKQNNTGGHHGRSCRIKRKAPSPSENKFFPG
jgi:hypothetical protein